MTMNGKDAERISGTDFPVLLLTFNRANCTQRVFRSIREQSPTRLYISSDGGRSKSEHSLVLDLREKMLRSVDWDCHVETFFQDRNLGCRLAVTSALNWFFENEKSGIILEDDCLPHPSFFKYCAHMLTELYSDERYASISGSRFRCYGNPPKDCIGQQSRVFHCWGWASWRRAWRQVNTDAVDFDYLKNLCNTKGERRYWENVHDIFKDRHSNSWAYQYSLNSFLTGKRHILPPRNMIQNIGFSESSTHSSRRPFIAFKKLDSRIDIPWKGTIQDGGNLDEKYYRTRFRSLPARMSMRTGYLLRDLVNSLSGR